MMSNKYKGILIFAVLYTVLFVFDGVKLLASSMPSAIANYLKYLVYVVLALYGSFLFKDRLIQQWNEIRKTKRKFFFGVLKGGLFFILMTLVFEFVSEMLKQFFGLVGQSLNQSNIQSTFQEQPLLLAVFACIIGPLVEELLFRQLLLHYLQKRLPGLLSIILVGLVFALTHMHSLALSEWVSAVGYLGGGLAFSIIYVKEKENIYYPLLVHMLGNSLNFIILVISSMWRFSSYTREKAEKLFSAFFIIVKANDLLFCIHISMDAEGYNGSWCGMAYV